MGYTSEKLERTVAILRQKGHVVEEGRSSTLPLMMIVDGLHVSAEEMYRMATPPDERFQFDADGKVFEIRYS